MAAVFAVLVAVVILERDTIANALGDLGDLEWSRWVPLAVIAEIGSMAAFARSQRRLLHAGGTPIHLAPVMAITYAGNAISVSIPIVGSGLGMGFSYRQLESRGVQGPVVSWVLALSGAVSTVAFALVIAIGAVVSGNPAAAVGGAVGALLTVIPIVVVLRAMRSIRARELMIRVTAATVRFIQRIAHRPRGDGAELARVFLERLASLRLRPAQLLWVFVLATWNWFADCLCLVASIRATHTHVPWHGILLAYGAGAAAGSMSPTPGGLGVVEVTLTAALVGLGISTHKAVTAVVLYRLISFWGVLAAGWVVYFVLHVRRQPRVVEVVEVVEIQEEIPEENQ
jgi:putative heme transporter